MQIQYLLLGELQQLCLGHPNLSYTGWCHSTSALVCLSCRGETKTIMCFVSKMRQYYHTLQHVHSSISRCPYKNNGIIGVFFKAVALPILGQKTRVALCNVAASGLQIPREALVLQGMMLQSSFQAWVFPPIPRGAGCGTPACLCQRIMRIHIAACWTRGCNEGALWTPALPETRVHVLWSPLLWANHLLSKDSLDIGTFPRFPEAWCCPYN